MHLRGRRSLQALVLAVLTCAGGCTSLPAEGPGRAWIYRHGGLVDDTDAGWSLRARVGASIACLDPQIAHTDLHGSVLDDDGVAAFAWPDGSLFVTRGLLAVLDDAQLLAALAHEVGHVDGTRTGAPGELQADRRALELLRGCGARPDDLLGMLARVRAHAGPRFAAGIAEREAALQRLLAATGAPALEPLAAVSP